MYSGTTFRKSSGKIIGVHQRIDRASRRSLSKIVEKKEFPGIKEILHFEGNNGPDSLKFQNSKLWHLINPDDPKDKILLGIISDHIMNLSVALRELNSERASFEAAWLAHAIVDGLTPAHHYPLEEKVKELWGKPRAEFEKLKEKHIIKGTSRRDTISRNWEYWGAGGIMTVHVMYELGVALAIVPKDYKKGGPSQNDIIVLEKIGFEAMFMESLYKIHDLKMFDRYKITGWSRILAKETKDILLPEIIKVVTLGWYQAVLLSREEA